MLQSALHTENEQISLYSFTSNTYNAITSTSAVVCLVTTTPRQSILGPEMALTNTRGRTGASNKMLARPLPYPRGGDGLQWASPPNTSSRRVRHNATLRRRNTRLDSFTATQPASAGGATRWNCRSVQRSRFECLG